MRDEMLATLVGLVPFDRGDVFRMVEIGSTDDELASALREAFPRARIVAWDRSRFKVDALDWWDVMFGADLVILWRCIDRLSDAKKQYLYKAIAERLTDRGVLFVGDRLPPQTLLHHLVWLKHAGFAAVDCFWMSAGQAVFGAFKQAGASAPPLRADN